MADHSPEIRVGFTDILTLVFIVLKVTQQITWSWWAVLSPLWVPVTIYIAVQLAVLLIDYFNSFNEKSS
ncbi:MAG TPA: hypothetical protein VF610_04575 [Segetibacter sp.]|jgi:hypothetical protein